MMKSNRVYILMKIAIILILVSLVLPPSSAIHTQSYQHVLKWTTILPQVNSRNAPLIVDLNNDGVKEIIVGLTGQNFYDRGQGKIYVLNHDGSILPPWPIDPEPGVDNMISTAAVADINRDGHMEIVAGVPVNPEGQGDQWWENAIIKIYAYSYQGQLLNGFPIVVAEDGLYPWVTLSLADLNNDGYSDIIVNYYNQQYRAIVTAFNYRGEQLSGSWPVDIGNRAASPMAIADVNGDGFKEIALGTDIRGIFLLRHNGTILPGWPVDIGPGFEGTPVTMGDIDKNGRLEIVTSSWREGHKLVAYDYTGRCTLSIPCQYPDIYLRHEAALVDLDKDGDLEILIPTFTRDYGTGRIDAFHHNGSLVKGWPVKYPGWIEDGESSNLVIGDIDNDGQNEVIQPTYTDLNDPTVPPQERYNGFINAWKLNGSLVPGFPIKYPRSVVGYEGGSLVLTDLDGTGHIDIVSVRCEEANSIHPKTYVSVFRLPTKYCPWNIEWSMYHNNLQHTGVQPLNSVTTKSHR